LSTRLVTRTCGVAIVLTSADAVPMNGIRQRRTMAKTNDARTQSEKVARIVSLTGKISLIVGSTKQVIPT
jgi:hypothetical protein